MSAKQNLALVYFSGQGVARDLTKALRLVDEAIEAGNYSAKPLREQILAEMSPAVQEDVQTAVAETTPQTSPDMVSADVQSELAVADSPVEQGETLNQSVPAPTAENNFVVTVPDEIAPEAAQPNTPVAKTEQDLASANVSETSEADVIAAADTEQLRSEVLEQMVTGEVSAVKPNSDIADETLTLASVQVDADTISQVTDSNPPAASASSESLNEAVVDEVAVSEKPALSASSGIEPAAAVSVKDSEPAEPFVNPVPPILEKEPGPYGMEADNWLMQQPSERYVIQLTNGEYKEGMEKYIRRVGLKDVEGWHFYRTQRDAGLYYVLVYGEFDTVAAAKRLWPVCPVRRAVVTGSASTVLCRSYTGLPDRYPLIIRKNVRSEYYTGIVYRFLSS
ncbi:hypothetical protein [Aliamphritea spongicola]|nr:hypothetical protein [Aliamphritea spongicola]